MLDKRFIARCDLYASGITVERLYGPTIKPENPVSLRSENLLDSLVEKIRNWQDGNS